MIGESWVWKREVAKSALLLAEWSNKEQTVENYMELELSVMTAAYATRKLVEANKLTTSVEAIQAEVSFFPYVGKQPVHLMNRHHIKRHYDFGGRQSSTLSLRELCNQLIHSFVFELEFRTDTQLGSLYFASDWEKHTRLYRITRGKLAKVFEGVACDDIASMDMRWNASKGRHDSTKLSWQEVGSDQRGGYPASSFRTTLRGWSSQLKELERKP